MGYLQMVKEVKLSHSNTSSYIPTHQDIEGKPSVSRNDDYDRLARSLGLVIGLSRECYFVTLNNSSSPKTTMIFVEKVDNCWEARRETFIKGRRYAVGIRKIVKNTDFNLVIKQVQNYFRSINVIN
jgi:hypothetical protein